MNLGKPSASAGSEPNREGPVRGLLLSEPVSRILSKATICLRKRSSREPQMRPCGLPGPPRAGSSVLLGLAPGGVCLAAASPRRRCALTAPFHLCLYATHVWPRHRPCISVALSRGFPRVGANPPPRPVVSGLSSRGFLSPRGRSARHSMVPRGAPIDAIAPTWEACAADIFPTRVWSKSDAPGYGRLGPVRPCGRRL